MIPRSLFSRYFHQISSNRKNGSSSIIKSNPLNILAIRWAWAGLWRRSKLWHGPRGWLSGAPQRPSMETSPAYTPSLIFYRHKSVFLWLRFSSRSLISFLLHRSPSSNTTPFVSRLAFSQTYHGFYRFVQSSLHSVQSEDHFLYRFWRDNHIERQWVSYQLLLFCAFSRLECASYW